MGERKRDLTALLDDDSINTAIPAEPIRIGMRYDEYKSRTCRALRTQWDALDDLAADLEEAKPTGLPRITAPATLVRLAIDYFLEHAKNDLHGATEAELRASIGLDAETKS